MLYSSPEVFLGHVLDTVRPYLDRLVLIGGFAVRIYEHHPRAMPMATQILRTFDADLATPLHLPIRGRPLSELAEAAGLQREYRGDHTPPVMKFVVAAPPGGSEGEETYSLEFLTPLTGPPADRAGRTPVTAEVQTGLTAQRLRYLDLLLVAPWEVTLTAFPGLDAQHGPLTVRIPHPGYFMVQKLLITGERTHADRRAKDLAYVYQVASLFRRELPALAAEVRTAMGGVAGWRAWLARARRQGEVLFASPNASGVTAAHRILTAELAGQGAEVPEPTMIHAGVRLFLNGL